MGEVSILKMTDDAFKFPTFDSMKQCAAVLGIPVSVQKEAKNGGCAAFEHNRVRPDVLIRFLFAEGNEAVGSKGPALERLNSYRADREKIKLDHDRNQAADKTEVITALAKGMSKMEMEMDREFKVNAPPALVGLDAVAICDYLTRAVTRFNETFRLEVDKLGQNGEIEK